MFAPTSVVKNYFIVKLNNKSWILTKCVNFFQEFCFQNLADKIQKHSVCELMRRIQHHNNLHSKLQIGMPPILRRKCMDVSITDKYIFKLLHQYYIKIISVILVNTYCKWINTSIWSLCKGQLIFQRIGCFA